MYGGTKQGLSLDDVKNYVVLLPPLDDQARLVTRIENTSSSVDRSIRNVRREIGLLREYHAGLIADLVTGKVDVRQAAARLPEDVEEPDEGDELDTEADVEESSVEVDAVAAEAEA
jgi:type I restriction enzyme S subunit